MLSSQRRFRFLFVLGMQVIKRPFIYIPGSLVFCLSAVAAYCGSPGPGPVSPWPAGARLLTSSSQCGTVWILEGSGHDAGVFPAGKDWSAIPGEVLEKYKRRFPSLKKKPTGITSFKTPTGSVLLKAPPGGRPGKRIEKKDLRSFLMQLLESELRMEVKRHFDAENRVASEFETEKMSKYLSSMNRILFPEKNPHPERQIGLYLAMYPEIAAGILGEPGNPLRPLYCHYQKKQHNIKIGKRLGHLIVIPALALGAASIIVGSQGLILAPLAVSAGFAAVLAGMKDIGYGIYQLWGTEKAAYLAKRQKKIFRELCSLLKKLDKKGQGRGLAGDELRLQNALRKFKESSDGDRRKHLSKLCRKRHFNRMLIAFGILNAGFNSVNLSGDPTILGRLPGLLADWLDA